MKFFHWTFWPLLAGVLIFSGCGKSKEPMPAGASVAVIDATKLRPAFESASPQTKAIVDDVMMSIQDSAYPKALAGLDKLAGLPDLTEAQKKVVADLSAQLKKKLDQQAQ